MRTSRKFAVAVLFMVSLTSCGGGLGTATDDKGGGDATDLTTWDGIACEPGEGCPLETCADNSKCQSGFCVEHLGSKVCTASCQGNCPAGWVCKETKVGDQTVSICVSEFPTHCRPCIDDKGCDSNLGAGAEVCVAYGDGGAFCGAACSGDSDCPKGYVCQESQSVDGIEGKYCVGEKWKCPCTALSVELGLATSCLVTNDFGSCPGERVCEAEGEEVGPCSASVPMAEECNGLDDDCNGKIDDEACNDGNPCTQDICNGIDGCQYLPLSDVDCDDGEPCTLDDRCIQGVCLGNPKQCNDDNLCTDDSCDAQGECLNTPNQSSCDDGDVCTFGDKCSDGVCAGTPVACDCVEDLDCDALDDGNLCNGTLHCELDGGAGDTGKCAVKPGTVVECPMPEGPNAACLEPDCDPATGACGFAPANEGALCDDGDSCSVADKCINGVCKGTMPFNCNDGNPCTDDICHSDGGCEHMNNTEPCQDGDVCTVGDVCSGGFCKAGTLINCDDGNVCTEDSCDYLLGCVHVAKDGPCDDGNLCTEQGQCVNGVCVPSGGSLCDDNNVCTTDWCDPNLGCMHQPNTFPCSDGDACTLADSCAGGQCVPGVLMSCDDGNFCTDDSCNPDSGCKYDFNNLPCDDNNTCTTMDVCTNGVCKGTGSFDCDDNNPCTKDICLPNGCDHENLEGVPCSDGSACTVGDLCSGGQCVPGKLLDCNDGNPCTDDSCDPAAGCQHKFNSAPCDDQNVCTAVDVCANGVCKGTGSFDCDDNNPCTKDLCVPDGCVHENLNSGLCDDGNVCTLGDKCANGKCVPGAVTDCDDGNVCTDDSCDPVIGCQYKLNNAPCDDNYFCTPVDICSNGVCKGMGSYDCDDQNPCTKDSCHPEGCVNEPLKNVPCNDGDLCTSPDMCIDGMCMPGPKAACDDSNVCTDDACDPKIGCVYKMNNGSCDDGNLCTDNDFCMAGICAPGAPIDCSDGNVCTNDACSPQKGCQYTFNSSPCDDGDACTKADTCSEGKCVPLGTLNCDDGNICTDDSCDPKLGCVLSFNNKSCDDGNPCTIGDTCMGGNCKAGTQLTCKPGYLCYEGECVLSCQEGLDECGGQCVNLLIDNSNCGECYKICAPGTVCTLGECLVTCQQGLVECGGICVNLLTDNKNCGECNKGCAPGTTCLEGDCVLSCQQGLVNCSGICTNTSFDPDNCGDCGKKCPTAPHASTTYCAGGKCGFMCDLGFENCNFKSTDGCEVDLKTDKLNCNSCGNVCPSYPHADTTCVDGSCGFKCQLNWDDCNKNPQDGCEADLLTSNTHCGKCNNSCSGNATCQAGVCKMKPAACTDILTTMNMWGRVSKGVDLRKFTNSTLHYLGCPGDGCSPDSFYCNYNESGQTIEFGSSGTVRSVVDPKNLNGDTMPTSYSSCCNAPMGLCNGPDANNNGININNAKALCSALGYKDGQLVAWVNSNTCPEAHVEDQDGLVWNSDFQNSYGYGRAWKCTGFK